MDDQDSIANRDEAIPIFRIPSQDSDPNDAVSTSEAEQQYGARDILRGHASKIRDKWDEYSGQSLQDRFFTGLMSHIVPPEELSENEEDGENGSKGKDKKKDRRS
ncbi:hypothetical protein KC336_g21797, partial [Hortaea werneckii]